MELKQNEVGKSGKPALLNQPPWLRSLASAQSDTSAALEVFRKNGSKGWCVFPTYTHTHIYIYIYIYSNIISHLTNA